MGLSSLRDEVPCLAGTLKPPPAEQVRESEGRIALALARHETSAARLPALPPYEPDHKAGVVKTQRSSADTPISLREKNFS